MNIVYVTLTTPWPATTGTRQRNAHILEYLAARHSVRAVVLDHPPTGKPEPCPTEYLPPEPEPVTPPPTVWTARLLALGNLFGRFEPEYTLLFDTPAFRKQVGHLRSLTAAADAVWVSRSYVADLLLRAGVRAPMVVDYDDIMTWKELAHANTLPWSPYRMLAYAEVLKLFWLEQRLARQVRRMVVCKPEDVRFFRTGRNRVRVVPNGATNRPAAPPGEEQSGHLLFVGLMSYSPNVDAVLWFARHCLPLLIQRHPDLRVDVVGAEPPAAVLALAGSTVHVHGFVPDLTMYYHRAAVVIAPVRHGGGTKLKVLEALGYGKAVVATSEATTGLGLQRAVEYAHADTPAEFVEACDRLLRHSTERLRMGRAGRECVRATFSWQRVGDLAERALLP